MLVVNNPEVSDMCGSQDLVDYSLRERKGPCWSMQFELTVFNSTTQETSPSLPRSASTSR